MKILCVKKDNIIIYNIISNMLPIPIILVISIGGIVVTAITIESLYVYMCNVIQKYKNNKLTRKYQDEITNSNPIIEI